MKNKANAILLAVTLVCLLASAGILYGIFGKAVSAQQLSTQSTATTGNPAPDFTVYDRNGDPVRLEDLKGKPVVLNFWASWCGPCQSEMPDFEEKYKELGDRVHFMMVNATDGGRETEQTARAFVDKTGYTFPVYFDLDQTASYTYSVYSLPTTYFIDAAGNLVAQATGAIDAQTLQQGIDLILPQP